MHRRCWFAKIGERYRFEERLDERCAELRDDGVAVGAQSSAARGRPISQQAKAGSNATLPAIRSVEPDRAVPCAAMSRVTPASETLILRPSAAFPVMEQSFITWPPSPSPAVGVGHSAKVEPVASVRGPDGASWQSGAPDGIASFRQISPHSSEPFASKRACNLFAKEDWRSALADEAEPDGEEMSRVGCPPSLAPDAERLARRRTGPAFEVFASGELESEDPACDPGEEVTLSKPGNVIWTDGLDWSVIDLSIGNQSLAHEVAQPRAQERVAIVVVDAAHGHGFTTR
jgi:hypothetical protein